MHAFYAHKYMCVHIILLHTIFANVCTYIIVTYNIHKYIVIRVLNKNQRDTVCVHSAHTTYMCVYILLHTYMYVFTRLYIQKSQGYCLHTFNQHIKYF